MDLRDYVSHGAAGQREEMRKDVYRYLWSLNSLPERLIECLVSASGPVPLHPARDAVSCW